MEYTITSETMPIDFGATGAKEVLQNCRMILTTIKFSCPLDRDFAIDPNLDGPINITQAKLTAQIVAAIKKYEPRARVKQVTYKGDGLGGKLKPVVKVEILDAAV